MKKKAVENSVRKTGGNKRPGNWTFGINGMYQAAPTMALSGYATERVLSQTDGRGAPPEASGEEWARDSRARLYAYSREFHRNSDILSSLVTIALNHIVGRGFGYQARSGDRAWNRAAEEYRNNWWNGTPDFYGELRGSELERMACSEYIQTGEMLALLVNDGTVQLFEAEQLCGRSQRDSGVITDPYGRITGYEIAQWDKTGMLQRERRAVSARHVVRAYRKERPSAKRGLPLMQAVFPMLHRIGSVLDSEAIAWQMCSKLAIAVLTNGTFDPTASVPTWDPDRDPTESIFESDVGMVYFGRPGDSVSSIENKRPSQNFPESCRMFLRFLGLPLGMPLELLLLDYSNAGSYTAARAMIEDAVLNFQALQDPIEQFNRTITTWKIAQGIASGDLSPAPADWNKQLWIRPRMPLIDVMKEVQGKTARLSAGLMTYGEACAEMGRDADDQVDALVEDTVRAMDAAKRVEARTGKCVPWQRFAGLEVGKTEAAFGQLGGAPVPGDAPAEEEEEEEQDGMEDVEEDGEEE